MQILILKLAWIETFTIDPAGLFGRIYMESSEHNVAYAISNLHQQADFWFPVSRGLLLLLDMPTYL